MSWITFIWAMLIGLCVAMAFPQFLIWIWRRRVVRLFFVILTASVIALLANELVMMRSSSAEQFARALRWRQLPLFVLFVTTVGFVRLYFGTGRWWLGVTTCAVRLACLVINFVLPGNLYFTETTELRSVYLLGDAVSAPIGVVSPWSFLAELSSFFLLVFVVDASISLWHQGKPDARRRALIIGGSIVSYVVLAAGLGALVHVESMPALAYFNDIPFVAILAAMAFELSYDLFSARLLSQKLQVSEASLSESEQRFKIVADSAPVFIWMSGTDKLCNFFNKPWLDFTGRTMEQEMGNGWAEGVHPDDLRRCHQTYITAFDAREPFVMEYRLRRHDGQYRWIRDDGVPRYDAQKNFTGYIGSCMDITEMKSKEQALRESNERIDLATKAAGLTVWTWDIPRDEVWLSEKDRALFGFSPSEKLTAKRIRSVVHADDRELLRQLVEKSLKTNEELEGEYRIVLGDGRVRWVTRRGRVEFDGDGNPICERGVLIDITEVIKNKEALRESEERMSLAMDAAKLGLWEWNVSKDELWGTKGRRALLGLPASGNIKLEDALTTVHVDDRDRVREALKESARTGKDYQVEYRTVLPDGSIRWTNHRGYCVRGTDGKSVLLRGVSMDVTEQRRAEEEFRLAVEASPSGILLVNETGQIVLVNTHIEELFGYGREELVGRSVEILVPERLAGHHPEHRTKFFAAPTARPMGAGRELFGRRKDGSEFPVEIGLNPIETSEGVLILAAVVDVSARKRAEEEAQSRRDEINRLTRVSLLGEMAGSIAHEVNQPLGAMMANASAMMHFIDRGHVNAEQLREILSAVQKDGRRARDVISNIRDTIKKGSVARKNVALNDIVQNVMHMVQPDAAALSCELRASLAEPLPTIDADSVQIQQVLINLLGNAFDAMRDIPPGQRKVEIATELDDGLVRVSVRDHGTGIAEASRERLFEQFYTTKEDGLGMGLAIVRSIIQAHSGTISAENAEGGGARFVFALPTSNGSLK